MCACKGGKERTGEETSILVVIEVSVPGGADKGTTLRTQTLHFIVCNLRLDLENNKSENCYQYRCGTHHSEMLSYLVVNFLQGALGTL